MTGCHAVGVPDLTAVSDTTGPETSAIVDAVESAGGEPLVAVPSELATADVAAIVAPGDRALRTLALETPTAPLLPIECDATVQSISVADLEAAVFEALEAGDHATTKRHALLAVDVDGERVGTALRDATLVTAAPARISEFAIDSDAVGRVDEVRADGVVVATPAGSRGYAAAGDGPLLAPSTGLAVVPVAPFRTDRASWVLPEDGLAVQIRRDEASVTVEVDGTPECTVGQDATVRFEPVGSVDALVVEQSGPAFP